ncbi:hypothetical protein [Hymenobacter sp. DG01]|uniref:hypothetical protein n=1 Tax=Hymenobacter sp. DG01 TaxID=2584940 RepID=UPI001124C894|nr:hypothetical protein [Hymenobacter sp. DG01]
MSADNPSPQVVEQRVRNLIIEYVQMVSQYKTGEMPGLIEVICMWEDYVFRPLTSHHFQEPVYAPIEKVALENVDRAWADFATNTTPEMVYENELAALTTPEWHALVLAALNAAEVLSERGKLSED